VRVINVCMLYAAVTSDYLDTLRWSADAWHRWPLHAASIAAVIASNSISLSLYTD